MKQLFKNEKQQTSTEKELTPTQNLMVQHLTQLNLVTHPAFPAPTSVLADYAEFILKEKPEITPDILRKIVRMMVLGEYSYNPDKGIAHVFACYEQYSESRVRYQLFNVDSGTILEKNEDNVQDVDCNVWHCYSVLKSGQSTKEGGYPDGLQSISANLMRARQYHLKRHERTKDAEPFQIFKEKYLKANSAPAY